MISFPKSFLMENVAREGLAVKCSKNGTFGTPTPKSPKISKEKAFCLKRFIHSINLWQDVITSRVPHVVVVVVVVIVIVDVVVAAADAYK